MAGKFVSAAQRRAAFARIHGDAATGVGRGKGNQTGPTLGSLGSVAARRAAYARAEMGPVPHSPRFAPQYRRSLTVPR
jgi:hypothetical protein